MSFQEIPKIEEPDFYLGVAFRAAKKKAGLERGKTRKDRMIKSKLVEEVKLETIKISLSDQLTNILEKFPRISQLDDFYQELFHAMLDVPMLRKSLAAVKWAIGKEIEMSNKYIGKIRKCHDITRINHIRREYYGRISSVIKQIKSNLIVIEESRKAIKDFPVIKTQYETVAIVGFPNVGKSTLLSKLTGSTPEINSYAFTTKGINVGYVTKKYSKVQVLDTPGTLNRFNKMNDIERQAYLVVKHLASKLIYVFDLTEPYPMKMQEELFRLMKKVNKPMFVYLSKTDILEKEEIDNFLKKHKISTIDELKKEIRK